MNKSTNSSADFDLIEAILLPILTMRRELAFDEQAPMIVNDHGSVLPR